MFGVFIKRPVMAIMLSLMIIFLGVLAAAKVRVLLMALHLPVRAGALKVTPHAVKRGRVRRIPVRTFDLKSLRQSAGSSISSLRICQMK